MKSSFSFSEKPILFLLNTFPLLLPGIEKIICIYYDRESEQISAKSLRKEKDEYFPESIIINEEIIENLQKLRNNSAPYLWMQPSNLPFEIGSKERVQLSIFNELNNNILLLRVYNEFDGCHDLFFIYFNQNPGNFGVIDSNKSLTTENKSIIGHLLKNMIETLIRNFKEDRELYISLSDNNQNIINELSHTKREIELIKEKSKDGITHLCKIYLADLSRERGYHLQFSDDAIKKLREFDGDLGFLRGILEKAIHFALSMQVNRDTKEILISAYHLNFSSESSKKKESSVPASEHIADIPARYNKTYLFLNKLESAAQNVKSKNLLLTSMNVGSEFPSPVTPSAITDALKNHQSKIRYLFKELPHQWQIIRSEFRPVQNILNPSQERQKRTG
jgi:hypothetical protein